ncbi:MAG: double-strand break repair helicase AddA [Candidatus Tokpelaia sp.]|nr:MAG: double-strand break repair helicase AddA [Candidatus Tokpelaia sp.]KAA6406095.1 double-strand break repair helicase AddA [Candidatus Tokpelaia sp.]
MVVTGKGGRMKAQFTVPASALAAQRRSSDPQASVWVAANAGSGKTHVLTERVIRLLLRGTRPAQILCLTYTKAAAANMQSRIFNRLAEWTKFDDSALAAALEKLEGTAPDNIKLCQARRLFAYALETPGGLKIQTIHAFCESLLHRFPLEANIPGHFELMDDTAQANCLKEVKKQLFAEIYHAPDSVSGQAFTLILQQAGEEALHKLLAAAIADKQNLGRYCAYLAKEGEAFFTKLLGLQNEAQTAAARQVHLKAVLVEEVKHKALFDSADLSKIAVLGGQRAQDFVARLKAAAVETQSARLLDTLISAYCKMDGTPHNAAYICGKKAVEAWPELEELFARKAGFVLDFADKLKSADLIVLNSAAYRLIQALLARYHAAKRAQGRLDFGDLIERALALLKRRGAGQWVQYKLDQGIDHILVDEAQDTGPEQWEIIRLLSQDFFSGLGAREDLQRTVFAVGDEKQSIYSFQGAAPQDFARNGAFIEYKARNVHYLFRRERLDFSFRSTEDIISAVDDIFALPQNYQGLSAANEPVLHSAIRLQDQGYVDIWPAIAGQKQQEPEEWTEIIDSSDNPATILAGNITAIIAHWLRNKDILAGKNRPVKAGDIMILVRKRGSFVHALARALKNSAIPVAGADRLHLADHIAVQDLMALGAFILQPRDDLALACALKSPLFNVSEETLLALAAERKGTLFAALEQAAEQGSMACEQKILTEAAEKLRLYRAFADIKPVYEFYDKILAEDGGRRRFLARLGIEAGDILDAFLDYCLSAEKTGLPGLQIFLQDLSRNSPEIKRELDQNRDEIRIMTVHAAKGLEAPIVFLVDGGSAIWHSSNAPCLLPLQLPEKLRPAGSSLPVTIRLWLPKTAYKTNLAEQILDKLKTAAEEEYRRLLYVGMTRAEDRLILCGYYGAKQPTDSWLPLVGQALGDKTEFVAYPAGIEQVRRHWHKKAAAGRPAINANQDDKKSDNTILPVFLTQKTAFEPALPRPLTASGSVCLIDAATGTDPDIMRNSPILPVNYGLADNAAGALFGAMEKGSFIHALLQYLPDSEPKLRRQLAQAYIKARLPAIEADNQALQQEILTQVFNILENAHFAPLFGAKSRAEAAVTGFIRVKGQQRLVVGQIDRLAVFADHILFADYKTGRPPATAPDIPHIYKMQMALYAALLACLYPRKTIKALLIYTREGLVFPFTAAELSPLLR